MEKVKKEKRRGEVSPEEGSQFYQPEEVTRTYKNDEFFAQVLKQGQSPKSQGHRLAVTGEPGAGKTTLLQKIAQWVVAETEQDVAIWVSLADLQGRTVEEYLLQKWLKDALAQVRVTPEMEEALTLLFNSGQVWLLLDGMDEMASGNPLATVANQISGWVAEARVVVTCRQNVWDAGKNALEGFDVYRNLDFDYPEGVGQFIQRWFKPHPELGERLLAELAQDGKERIRDTVRNPLRLVLLCRAWQIRQGGLPETKAGLYEQFAKALYEWKQEAFPTTSQQRRDLNAALGRLALRGMEQSESRFRLKEGLVTEILGEKDEPLCKLALQLGWLNLVGIAVENPDERVYAFYHPTFQEYFAALAINDWDYFLPRNHGRWQIYLPVKNKYYRVFEKQWKEVILLWLGRNDLPDEEKDEFIKKLAYFKDGTIYNLYGFHAIFLAAVGINEFKKCKLSDNIILTLICFALDIFHFHNAQLPFGGKLENMDIYWSNMKISSMAKELLAHTIKEKIIATIVELLEMATDTDFCSKIMECLKQIPLSNKLEVTPLIELIKKTEKPNICYGIVHCLGQIQYKDERAINVLNKMLETTTEPKNRWDLAHALAQIDPGNEIAIKELIWNSYTWNKRILRQSLTQVNDANKRAIIAPGNEMAIRELTTLLETTTEPDVLRKIAECLGQIDPGNLIAIGRLTNLLETTTSLYDCLYIAESLGQIAPGNELAISALTNLLKLPETYNDSLSIWAAQSLDKIAPGNELAGQFLIEVFKLLESPKDESIPRDFTYILKKKENSEDLFEPKNIIYMCNDAIHVLGEMSPVNKLAVIEALIGLLEAHKNDEVISSEIAGYLEIISYANQLVIEAFIQLLNTTTGVFNRAIFAFCLGKVDPGNKLAIKVLITLLKITKNEGFRKMITGLLWEINPGNQQTLNQLIWEYESIATLKNKENIPPFSEFSKMIWQATQTVSYPSFYKLWFYNSNLVAIYGIYRIIYAQIHKFANVIIVPLKEWLKNKKLVRR